MEGSVPYRHAPCSLMGKSYKGLGWAASEGPSSPLDRPACPLAPAAGTHPALAAPPVWLLTGLESLGSVNGKAWVRAGVGTGRKGAGWEQSLEFSWSGLPLV